MITQPLFSVKETKEMNRSKRSAHELRKLASIVIAMPLKKIQPNRKTRKMRLVNEGLLMKGAIKLENSSIRSKKLIGLENEIFVHLMAPFFSY